jgi:acyl-CoA thioester hydrolase
MARSDFSFFHSLRVRWSEVDMQAIVFSGHYLNYFDVAFTEYWRRSGLPDVLQQASDGRELFARKATVEYLAPARFDNELEIGVRCAALGRSSLRFAMEIHCGDVHLISGELVYVYADAAARKSTEVPGAWREAIRKLEKIPPQE